MWERLLSLEMRRKRAYRRAPEGVMRQFLSHPFTAAGVEHLQVEYLALDLETTGLDAEKDQILSMGWVVVSHGVVHLGSAQHHLVRPSVDIPAQSAVIHQITDSEAAQGLAIEAALIGLLQVLQGRVLLAHHAQIEVAFIRTACRRLFGGEFLVPVVDTEWMERRRREQQGQLIRPGALRLAAIREHYHLPRYPAHNALSDALAAAELFLAQVSHRSMGQPMQLRQLLRRGYP